MSLIVGSVTQSSDGDPTPFDDPVWFYFRNRDGEPRFRLESAEITGSIWGPADEALADPGLEKEHGKLFAMQLPPGTYQLVRFAIKWPSQQQIDFAEPVEFELVAGEAVYLGNLDARFCVRHAYANQYGVAGVVISVNDELSRDTPLLKNRFPALRQAVIVRKLLDDVALEKMAGSLGERCRQVAD